MPILEITSPRTGKTYRIEGSGTPTAADIEEIGNHLDAQEARAAGVDPEVLKQGPLGTIANKVRDVGPGFVGSVMQTGGELLQSAAENLSRLTGIKPGTAGRDIARAGEVLQQEGEILRPTNPFNETAQSIGSGVQQALGILSTMGAAAPVTGARAAWTTVPLVLGGVQGGGQGVMTAREMGIENPFGQLALGGAFGAAEILTERLGGIGHKGLSEAVQKGLAGTLKQVGKTVGIEAIEEPIAGAAQDIATRVAGAAVEDPARPGFTTSGYELPKLDAAMVERRKQEAIGGAAGGLIFGGAQIAANPRSHDNVSTTQTPSTADLEETTDELTSADVADIEWPRAPAFTDPAAGVMQLDPQADLGRDFQLKQQASGFRDDPFAQPQDASGDIITDLRIPRSPAAVAESQRDDPFAQPQDASGDIITDLRIPRSPAAIAESQRGQSFASRSFPTGDVLANAAAVARGDQAPAVSRGLQSILPNDSATRPPAPRGGTRKGLGVAAWFQKKFQKKQPSSAPQAGSPPRKEWLRLAYQHASQGQSSAFVPLSAVFEKLQAADPGLTRETFAQEVQQAYEANELYLEGANTLQEAAASGLAIEGTPVGTAVRMAFADASTSSRSAPAAAQANEITQPQLRRAVTLGTRMWDMLWGGVKKPVRFKAAHGHTDNGRFTPTDGAHDEIELNHHAAGLEEDAITVIHELAHAQDSEGLDSMSSENPTPGTAMARLMDELNEALPTAKKLNAAVKAWKARRNKNQDEQEVADYLEYLARPEERFARAVEQVTRWLIQGRVLTGKGGHYTSGYLTRAEMERILPLLHEILGHGTHSAPLSPAQNQPGRSETRARPRDRSSRPEPAHGGPARNDGAGNEGVSRQPAETVAPNETQSRFASPNAADRAINGPRTDSIVAEEARQWLDSVDTQAAVEAFVNQQVPLPLDAAEHAAAVLIARLSDQAATGKTEVARMWAHVQGQRMARVWTKEFLSADPARALRQRGVVNSTILAPIAPVLAAQEMLVDRAKKVIDQRFDGGTEGAVEKTKAVVKKADQQAGEELANDLNAESENGSDAKTNQIKEKHPSLKRMLDALRKKLYPGMTWADIFMELPETQKERQREIYRRLKLDQRLSKLTPQERLDLTNELDKAWQRERRKVFLRELEKAGVIGEKKPKDREKVKAAAPRLLRLMNLGLLNSEMFREALAKEYGLKVIDVATAAELRKLGEKIQQAPEGLPRRKLETQMLERLQQLSNSTLFQIIDSWWTASVLSGWRTQVDIGLSIANGIEDVGLGSVVTALRTGQKDVAVRALGALFGRIPSAFMEAVNHVATGNKVLMRNFELEAKQALEGGNRLASDVGAEMWRKGGWRAVPGAFMIFYGRLMTALDHLNAASTMEGAKLMALARHPELYQQAIRTTPLDWDAALTQAKLEMLGGAEPKSAQERLEVKARQREIIDQQVPVEVIAEAREIGRRSALQGDPSGLGGLLLEAINRTVGMVAIRANRLATREKPDAISRQLNSVAQAMVPLARAITGTKFARTVGHALNRTTSYVPGLGLYTVGQEGRTGAFGDILAARQVIGTLVGIALYLAFDDDDDERGIEDGWKDKTPQEKSQLYAQGKQPFTVWQRDAQGRVRSYNYQQWGIAGIMNTVAVMLNQKDSEQGAVNVLMSSLTQGMMSFTDKAQLQGLQTVFDVNSRSTDPASGIASNLNKWAAQTVGGLIPRLVKDIDMVASPELRTSSEWWQKWAKEVPMVRQLSSGKRVDIFGEDIQLDRGPLSRVMQIGTADPDYRLLARLNAKDLWLPDPSQGVRVVKLNDGRRRNMNPHEKDRYQRLTGQAYRQFVREQGESLLQMEPEKAHDIISRRTSSIRDRAAYQATH